MLKSSTTVSKIVYLQQFVNCNLAQEGLSKQIQLNLCKIFSILMITELYLFV